VEPTGGGLDQLDLAVQPFRNRIGCAVPGEVQDAVKMTGHHVLDLDYRLQFGAIDGVAPVLEKVLCGVSAGQHPERPEHVLQRPCGAGLQLAGHQLVEFGALFVAHVFRVAEPGVLRADECFVAGRLERSGLLTTNGIDGIIEILADVVMVVHEVCMGDLFPDGMGERLPHVDRD